METASNTYPAIFVSLNALLLTPTAEPTLINQYRQILLHHFIDLSNSRVKAFL
jgi:hypothetical protein